MSRTVALTLVILVAGWTLACIAGFGLLWSHASAPGERATPPAIWPSASDISIEDDRSLLLVFIHPHCPCTRATLAELRRSKAEIGPHARVVVVAHDAVRKQIGVSENVALAQSIPGVEIYFDPTGAESARFGARTSGQALLYSPDGLLQFQGGITPSRGHEGPSVGATAIRKILASETPDSRTSAVFGCSLTSTSSAKSGSRTPRL